MNKYLSFLIVWFLFAFPVFSQTAQRLEALLNTEALSYDEAAAFVLEAANIRPANAPVFAGPAQAFSFAVEQNWLPRKAEGSDAARLDEVSLLIMKAFGFRGGAFYTLFQTPHYAYRELQYRNMLEGRTLPAMNVSGELLLFVLSRALDHAERIEG